MFSIGLDEANRYCLHKQYLTKTNNSAKILEIIKAIGGLHATEPQTPFLSLLARMIVFEKQQLDEKLYIEKVLGKVRFARKTLYIIPKEWLPMAFSAMSSMLFERYDKYLGHLNMSRQEYKKLTGGILNSITGTGSTTRDIKASIKDKKHISAVVNMMCDQGLLIRGEPRYGWKSNIHTYYRLGDCFPDLNINEVEEGVARKFMVMLYIQAFGPVTPDDISWWTGFKKTEVKEILNGLDNELESFKIDELKGLFMVHKREAAQLKSLTEYPKYVINILPRLDPYLMGYKGRERFISQKNYHYVYDRSGNATNSIVVNGKIIGVWDLIEKPEALFKLFFFKNPKPEILSAIHAESHRTGSFLCDSKFEIKACQKMVPLNQKTAGSFMSPLKDC